LAWEASTLPTTEEKAPVREVYQSIHEGAFREIYDVTA
jgi:hypothetical protein